MESRRPVGRPKKTWSKVVEEMRKLNNTDNMAEGRKQYLKQLTTAIPKCGKLWMLNNDDDDELMHYLCLAHVLCHGNCPKHEQ